MRKILVFIFIILSVFFMGSCDNVDLSPDEVELNNSSTDNIEISSESNDAPMFKEGQVEKAKDSNFLEKANLIVSDKLYQSLRLSDKVLNNDVVIVGIDDVSFDELGQYINWKRDKVAEAIQTLNKDANNRPAAIGVDVLYLDETEPEYDNLLINSANEYNNVCFASFAMFDDIYKISEDGTTNIYRYYPKTYNEPFEKLKNVSTVGHINVMSDTDDIIRHHLLEFKYENEYENKIIPSFALAIANKYNEFYGKDEVKRPITDEYGFWYVPFSGKPGSHIEVPISELINNDSGNVDYYIDGTLIGKTPIKDLFAGKIVLIGPYAPGLQDAYAMSVDHGTTMYGVEYHANVIRAMLDGRYAIEADDAVQIIVLIIILALALFLFWKRKVWISTVTWLSICFGWTGVCILFYNNGIILDVLYIPLFTTVLYVGCVAVNYIIAYHEKKKINDTFNKYVAPEIVKEILKDGDNVALGGKLVDIAVLFVDVRGFTTMSELIEPEKVVEILNKYLTLTSKCILSNGGTLDKFIGDATMAFWGAPLPQEDYVMRACKAAIEMIEQSKSLSEELLEKYGQSVTFGVGVHVGQAIVGNIGSPERMDYTAIGDTVNTAARLEANAPGGTVYISREVANRLDGRIITHSLGASITLKGKKEGFEVLVLEGIINK